MYAIQKIYHKLFIKKQYPEITLTLPMKLPEERVKTFPKRFVENMTVP